MQITLQQRDIETALRQYMAAQGIRADVESVDFSMARKSGNALTALVTLSDGFSFAAISKPTPRSGEVGISEVPAPVQTVPAETAPVAVEEPAPVAAPEVPKEEAATPVFGETEVAAVKPVSMFN